MSRGALRRYTWLNEKPERRGVSRDVPPLFKHRGPRLDACDAVGQFDRLEYSSDACVDH